MNAIKKGTGERTKIESKDKLRKKKKKSKKEEEEKKGEKYYVLKEKRV